MLHEFHIRVTTWKVSESRDLSGPYFLVFGPNLLRKSPYSVRMWENIHQRNFEFGYFSRIWILYLSFTVFDLFWLDQSHLVTNNTEAHRSRNMTAISSYSNSCESLTNSLTKKSSFHYNEYLCWKFDRSIRSVFGTLSNIFDGFFCENS